MEFNMNAISVAVLIEGRSWIGSERGVYCFEVNVNGVQGELRIQEELAFDFLGAWTFNPKTCLDILRLHRAELAQALALKLKNPLGTGNGPYLLTWRDLNPGPLASRLQHGNSSRAASLNPSRRKGDTFPAA
jgi:hypothetical protein